MRKILDRVSSVILAFTVIVATGCASLSGPNATIRPAPFGTTPDGRQVTVYTLQNDCGMQARILDYGGIIQSIRVPDKLGHAGDVVLGYDDLGDYMTNSLYFGALIGRYGNRIAKGRFELDGATYQLPINDGPNSLHGGTNGFDKLIWSVDRAGITPQGPELQLRCVSPDGDNGYPGRLAVTATYTLLAHKNELRLHFRATTDKDTVINLTAHSYFNLAGRGEIHGEVLTIPAGSLTPVDDTLIPTGDLEAVDGTPFDFRKPTAIGARIREDDQQLKYCHGYDLNWVIDKPPGQYGLMARVHDPTSGRVLEVWSDQPGVQFYSGNFLNGSMTGKGGWVYQFRDALSLEPQHYPDSPNHPNFPSTVLKPGQVYQNTIVYHFGVQ